MMNCDIFFISYNESNAGVNFEKLSRNHGPVRRIDKIRGIHNAYKKAAEFSETEYFYIVDADNEVLPSFSFRYEPTGEDAGTWIWQAINPVNDLLYGYGGIKLYCRKTFIKTASCFSGQPETKEEYVFLYDFPVCGKIRFMTQPGSITHFNSSPFDAWKGAFRECCKLTAFGAYFGHSGSTAKENERRVNSWLTKGAEKPFGKWVIKGAIEGRDFAMANAGNLNSLARINDFNWLSHQFQQHSSTCSH